MSRIVGLIDFNKEKISKLDSALCAAARGAMDPRWLKHTKVFGDLCWGWIGWKSNLFQEKDNTFLLLDGHIYNDSELYTKVARAKRNFYLIEIYNKLGFPRMLNLINGDFVITLYDKNINTLFIARDRFGIKPLYYFYDKEKLFFASRCSSLFALGVEAQPNPDFIGRFAGTHYSFIDIEPSQSPYRRINQLQSSHYLHVKIHINGIASPVVLPWWILKDESNCDLSIVNEEKLAEEYRILLLNAVKIRLTKSEKPIFSLSGGLDSSSVLAAAVYNSGHKFDAVSSVYVDKTYDESDEIQSMLNDNVEKWHQVLIDNPNVFDLIEQMISQHDEPVATATWLSHFLLCKYVSSQNFLSLFGGLGGDELNAGEYDYFFFHFADLKRSGNDHLYDTEVAKWCEYHDHPIFRKTKKIAEQGLQCMVDLENPGRCLPVLSKVFRYAKAMSPLFLNESSRVNLGQAFSSYLKTRMYQDLYFNTAPCCLRAEDRQAIAFNLDNFLPFFDYRLVEFMFNIPGTLKIRNGITKHILRKAMKGILPEETRTRIKKTGWNAPAHKWFFGKGLENVRDLIHSKTFQDRGIYNINEINKIIDEHESIIRNNEMKENHMMFIWQLVNTELWLKSISNTNYKKISLNLL